MGNYVCAKAWAFSIVSWTGTLKGLMDWSTPFYKTSMHIMIWASGSNS